MAAAAGTATGLNRLLAVACLPLLFPAFTRINSDAKQALFVLGVIALACTSHILARPGNRGKIAGTGAEVYTALWTAAAGLYLAAVTWNRLFRHEILESGYKGDIFRQVYWNFWAPVYGHPDPVTMPDIFMVAVLALSLYGLLRLHARRTADDTVAPLVCLALFNLLLIVAFALSQDRARLFQNLYDYRTFGTHADLMLFASLHDVWEKWNALMPALHGRNPHYPPGNLFILKLGQILAVPGLLKGLVILSTLLCVPLLYSLGRRLGFNRETALAVTALFSTSASATIFPTTSTAPLTMFFTLLCWRGYFIATGNNVTQGALLGGFALALYSLFSFTVFIAGLSLLVIGTIDFLLDRERRPAVVRTLVVTGAVFAASLFLLYLVSGFNAWVCLARSMQQNAEIMTAHPFDTAGRYLLRSGGNLLAYALYTGIVLTSLAVSGCSRLARPPRDTGIFITGCLITLLAAGFSGLFFMETGRIWVFFTPALAVAAGRGMSGRADSEAGADLAGVMVMANFLATSVQEICFRHFWA